jgi:TRAP-type C4-dicarboxylate transport system permease small subunit
MEGALTRAWDQWLILVACLAVCAALLVLAWQGWRR